MIDINIKKIQLGLLSFLAFLLFAQGAQAAITITRTSTPAFYSDIGNGLTDMYAAYRITTDTTITDGWAQIGNFSGPDISASAYESGLYHLGQMTAGTTRMVYFYLHTSAVSASTETHTVTLYDGKLPGGVSKGSNIFSLTQQDTIQANASKVQTVITGPNPATLGGIVTITVTGETGRTNGPMAFTPATDPSWRANVYKLVSSVVDLPDGTVLTDAPYLGTYSTGVSGTYVAVFTFIAEGSSTAPSACSPVGYINSGSTNIKHTQTGGYAGYPPPPVIDPGSGNAVVLSKFSDRSLLTPGAGGEVNYTLRLTNYGTIDVTLDDLVDTLPAFPAAVAYVAGSSKFNGIAIADPVISGSQLTWSGTLVVLAGSSRDLTFKATVPGTAGSYVNRAVGHIGTTQIDSTVTTTDNAPATSTVNVSTAPSLSKTFTPAAIGIGQESTLRFTITNGPGLPAQTNLGFIDRLPAGVTVTGTPSSLCGGAVTYNAGSNTLSLTGGAMAASTASCAITATVTSSMVGNYLNAYDSNPASSNISGLAGGLDATGLSATLQVSAPGLTKIFNPDTINANQVSTLTFTVTNGTGNPAQSGLGFTDTLPAGVVVATSPSVTTSCGGAVYKVGTTTPLAGGENAFSFSGGSLSQTLQNCTVTVNVRVTSGTLASYTNGSANMSGIAGGLLNNVTSQTLTVVSTPALDKAFAPATVGVGQPSTLTFTINNPASQSQTKLSFTDLFPAGLIVATPPNINSTCGGNVYRTGTTTAVTGSEGAIDFAGGSVSGNSSCTVSIKVTSLAAGAYTNSSTNITQVSGLTADAVSTRTLTVAGTTLGKVFGVPSIITGASTSLTFTITNSSGDPAQAGLGFADQLPAGLTVAGTPASSQCGGTVSYNSGSNTLSFAGGTLALGVHTCMISANVTSSTSGTYTNNSSNITSTAGGINASGANAALVVGTAPRIQVTKVITAPGRTAASDQFTVQISDNTGTVVGTATSSTTAGSGATVTAGSGTSSFTASALGVSYSLNEVMATGSGSPLSQYLTAVSCTNNGFAVGVPSSLGQSFTPIAGDNYACTISNTPAPTIRVTKALTLPGRIATNDQFIVQIKDNTGSVLGTTGNSTTAGSGAAINAGTGSSSYIATSLGGVYNLNEVMAGGSSSSLAQYITALSCTNNSVAVPGLTTLGQNFTPLAGDNYVCTITNKQFPTVSGTIYSDVNHNGAMDGGETGTGQLLYVKLAPRSGASCASPAIASTAANPGTGAYTLPMVTAGDYCLIIDDNATLTDTTPSYPSGWIGMEPPGGIHSITVVSAPVTARNFGMYNGGRLSGRVYMDTGAGGGIPNNGFQDGTEAGLAGVAVRVTDNGGGTTYDSTVTNGSGDYTLWIPATAGNNSIKITETNPGSYVSTGGNAGTTGGSYNRASDTVTFSNIVGTICSGVNFADVPGNTFVSNNSRSVVPGGVVFYPLTFTAGTGGIVTFTTSAVASPAISGWSEVLYLDSNCNGSIDSGEPQIAGAITTTAGQQVCILVKEFAPVNAPTNATNNVTVTATFGYSNSTLPTASLTVTDLTTVLLSGLTLLKYVDKPSAIPGDTLVYTINYVNTGFSQLSNIIISDNVPTFTNSPSACCVNPSTACLGAPPTNYPPSITGCAIVTTSSSVTWTLSGSLAPGASGQVKFSVKIDQ